MGSDRLGVKGHTHAIHRIYQIIIQMRLDEAKAEWKKGRGVKPGLKIGVCGEHGGDPSSIRFFHGAGLDYVSCSPYRVPIARLAAAQAQLEKPVGD